MRHRSQVHLEREIYTHLALVPKALASPTRLGLLDLLAQGETTVENLAEKSGQSLANTSQHLQVLRRAGLVQAHRDGAYRRYRLNGNDVYRLWQSVRAIGEARLEGVEPLLRELHHSDAVDAVEVLSLDELRDRLEDGRTLLLDVRPTEEYQAGHIPGALSIPIGELSDRLTELPEGAEIVAYGRGPYCVFADEAGALLRERGIPAARLQRGFPDWRAAGHPTETGGA